MKYYHVLGILLVIGIVFLLTGCKKQNDYSDDIKSFKYGYGSYFPGYITYEIVKKDDKYELTIDKINSPDTEKTTKTIDKKYVDEINKIINEYKVYKWDGFNKSDNNVMDGTGFSFDVTYENDKTISAQGYMKFPKDYKVVTEKIEKILDGIK